VAPVTLLIMVTALQRLLLALLATVVAVALASPVVVVVVVVVVVGRSNGPWGQLQRAVQTLLLPPQLGLTWLPTRGALMQPRTGCCARRRR
jgi:hypothetical protein